jgi:ubiquinone/menaquinone biosynthesis C-methylase UbiE
VHVDYSQLPHVDYVADVRCLEMFEDGSAELIYASHVLEYFDMTEVPAVLGEWHRVLVVGGTLRLAVPSFSALCELYKRTGCVATVLGPIYGRWDTGERVLHHGSAFDFVSLATLLRAAGFKSIRQWDWREVEHGGVDDFSQSYWPHMDKKQGLLLSLNVEANRA